MHLHKSWTTDTEVKLEVSASPDELASIKNKVLKKLAPSVKLPGFRAGNTPLELVEKQLGNSLQAEVLDEALNTMYRAALRQENIRPAAQPQVSVKSFVPFTQLECVFEVPCIGEIKLGDYKKFDTKLKSTKVVAADVQQVLDNLATRMAEKKDVERKSKAGDQLWIDFEGVDSKGEPIERADGKDYPLVLGSKTFIPGFEENLVGFKAGGKTEFTVTFPKDYGQKSLQNKKVTFKVTVNKVQEVVKPKFDDAFAKQVGPFKTIDQLKNDIKTQLQAERDQAAQSDLEAARVLEVAKRSRVAIPDSLVEEQAAAMIDEFKRDLVTRGQTWKEFLSGEGKDEEAYKKDVINPAAKERIKAGLILSAIAEAEGITVTEKELDARIAEMKNRYQDDAMLKELDKIENQQDIAARILSEKTIKFLSKR